MKSEFPTSLSFSAGLRVVWKELWNSAEWLVLKDQISSRYSATKERSCTTSRMTRSGVEESARRDPSSFKFRQRLSKAGMWKKILSPQLDHLRVFTRSQAS